MQLFSDLLNKEMDRREFLIYLGSILLTIADLATRRKTITDVLQIHPKATKGFSVGPYGTGSYGK